MYEYKSEKEFGESFVNLLRALGFETWQEVYLGRGRYLGNPTVDVIAKLKGIFFSFELKLSINDEVLEQAARNRKLADFTYVVAPLKNRSAVSAVKASYAKQYGIGIIYVRPDEVISLINTKLEKGIALDVIRKRLFYTKRIKSYDFNKYFYIKGDTYNICVEAKRFSRKGKRYKKGEYKGKLLIETYLFSDQKESSAGSDSGEKITPFKRSCQRIYNYLQDKPESTKRDVWDSIGKELHWSSYSSMCSSFRQYGNVLEVMKKINWKK